MRVYISIALLGVILAGCGKEQKPEKRVVFYPDKKTLMEEWSITRTPKGDTLLQGVRRQYFWNGGSKESVIWKDGVKHGSAQAWYDGGDIKWQKVYDEGKKSGTWRLYFKDGKPWMVLNFADNVMEGTVQVWDRASGEDPKTAQFSKGSCVSGDCGLLEAPPVAENITPTEQVEMNRQMETIREFLE
jgi:hypothetical protein